MKTEEINPHEIQTRGINLRTGKEVKLRPRYATGTDHAEFWCVWKKPGDSMGTNMRLCSFSAHRKHNVPAGHYRLLDSMWKPHIAPKGEVSIHSRI